MCAMQMRPIPTGLAVLIVTAAAATGLQGQAEVLRPFAPYVGSVWVAEGEAGSLGRYTAERTHEWTLGGQFLRVRQKMSFTNGTAIEEEHLIGWDPQTAKLRLSSFASDGSTGEGWEESGAAEGRFIFAGRTYGARAGEWRTTTFLIDATSFSVLVEMRSGKQWSPAMTLAFHKKSS
jgi:hypothetical protein